jgi:hypothetical protein
MSGPIDDATLRDIVQTLAKAHLEVERGLRSQDTFAAAMPPAARHAWLASRRAAPRLSGGAVDESDITIAGVERHASGRVYATALTPTHPDRRGALCFVLDVDEHVRIRQIQRLHPARDYGRPSPTIKPPEPPEPPEVQLRRARTDRQQAANANRELTRRLEQLEPGSPQHRLTRDTADSWRRIIARLDNEIATLQQRQQHQQRHEPPPPTQRRRR